MLIGAPVGKLAVYKGLQQGSVGGAASAQTGHVLPGCLLACGGNRQDRQTGTLGNRKLTLGVHRLGEHIHRDGAVGALLGHDPAPYPGKDFLPLRGGSHIGGRGEMGLFHEK